MAAAARIERGGVRCRTWEQLDVSGGLIISEILAAIRSSDVAVFEITNLNHNVMFELGFAIGSRSKIWVLRDTSFVDAERVWKQMRTLTTVGYTGYTNSEEISQAFFAERPDYRDRTIYDDMIGPILQPEHEPSVFYVRSLYDTDAARSLTRRIHGEEKRAIRVVEADPRESSHYPIGWYAQQIYAASGVLAHFDDPERVGSDVHNARSALVAGVALGMDKPLLMLAAETYSAPIDYRDLLYVYRTADRCVTRADSWLTDVLSSAYTRLGEVARRESRLRLATELRSLRLGEHVAENESDVLPEYFVRTAAYEEVLRRRTTVFVGRKGTGKSANALAAYEELMADRRQLVCLIKPYAYELNAVLALLERYTERDQKGYVIESLWKFLLYSEIALAAYSEIQDRPFPVASDSAEAALVNYLDEADFLTADFAVRLERTIENLIEIPSSGSIEGQRVAISERLHSRVIAELRRLLADALRDKVRVAILIDNLDRAWERGADTGRLAEFILGLLTAAEQLEGEFRRESGRREALSVTLAIFLRSDIYDQVSAAAAEPDKIPLARLEWRDPELLIQILEERYLVTREGSGLPDELWTKYFCDEVHGVDTRNYITWRTLPRPRDIVYFANAAITAAINHRDPRVEERDILSAEKDYSQFALEVLEVEDTGAYGPFGEVFFEFIGVDAVLSRIDVSDILGRAGVSTEDMEEAVEYLRSLSFLGLETDEGKFEFAEDPKDLAKIAALSRRRGESGGVDRRYAVHPAFRPYLEIPDVDLPPGQLMLVEHA